MKNYKEQIKNFILNNNDRLDDFVSEKFFKQLLGLELEHFIVDNNCRSIFYKDTDDGLGLESILNDLKKYYDTAKYSVDKDNIKRIIGLSREDAHITLEPGGQLEVAISAKESVHDIDIAYSKFYEELTSVLNPYNYKVLNLGYRPDLCALEVPVIPNNRYVAMDSRFKTIGTHGPCMMRGTCSTQVSIDFDSEQDCAKKLKVATALSPLFYFLYDNSPVFEKSRITEELLYTDFSIDCQDINRKTPSGFNVPLRMARYVVWNNTDNDRCGSLKIVFDDDFSIDKYVDSICDLPLIFARGHMSNLNNKKYATNIYGDFFYGPYSVNDILAADANLTKDEIIQVLTMIFFDARLKNVIELRGADSMPKKYVLSYAALIKVLFYNKNVFNILCDIFNTTTYDDYVSAGQTLYEYGWNAHVYNYNICDLFKKIIKLVCKESNAEDLKYLEPTLYLIKNHICLKDYFSNSYSNNLCRLADSFKPLSNTVLNTKIQKEFYLNDANSLEKLNEQAELHKKSKAVYRGKIVNLGYFSKVYDVFNVLQFSDIAATLHKILSKAINLYYKDNKIKDLFCFDDYCEKLINIDTGYNDPLPMSRFDIFFEEATGRFGICEFNTGGSAAMTEQYFLAQDIKKSVPFIQLQAQLENQNKNIVEWELFDTWIDKFVQIYYKWLDKNHSDVELDPSCNNIDIMKKKPFVAILDFLDDCQIVDFYEFKKRFKKAGYDIEICDLRDLRYDRSANKLFTKSNNAIDVVYKRVTYNDLYDHKDDDGVKAFIDAVSNSSVCSIDWFSTQIVHDKSICCVLHNDNFKKYLSNSEVDFINLHVPYTQFFKPELIDVDAISQKKDDFVIKPKDGRGSKSVYEGINYSSDEWQKILKDCLDDGSYIVQKYCKQYYSPNIKIDAYSDQKYENSAIDNITDISNMPGLFCYNGKFSGIFLRQIDNKLKEKKYDNVLTTCCFYEE